MIRDLSSEICLYICDDVPYVINVNYIVIIYFIIYSFSKKIYLVFALSILWACCTGGFPDYFYLLLKRSLVLVDILKIVHIDHFEISGKWKTFLFNVVFYLKKKKYPKYFLRCN